MITTAQQQVGAGQQAARQAHQLALATAEQFHRLIPLTLGHAQLAQQALGAAVQARPAQRVVRGQQLLVLGQHARECGQIGGYGRLAHTRLDSGDAHLEFGQVGARGQQLGQHSPARLAAVLLRQVAPQCDGALLGRLEPGQRAQQRRLPNTIRPDQADPLAVLQRPAQPTEDRAAAMDARDIVHVCDDHRLLLPGQAAPGAL
jgi:hypothetical protein